MARSRKTAEDDQVPEPSYGSSPQVRDDGPVAWAMQKYPYFLAGFLALFFVFNLASLLEWNADEDWQICQYPNGSYRVVDQAGVYVQFYGEVWTYPKFLDLYFSAAKDEGSKDDSSIRVTFSDSGTGFTSHHIKLSILPAEESKRLELHRHFASTGVNGMRHMIEQHLSTAVKNSGPLMSASEYHAQKRAEFYQVVRDQLEQGLFGMEVVEQEVVMQTPEKGSHQFSGNDVETVYKTRITLDAEKQPVQIVTSPLREYGLFVQQYSITNTSYDQQTTTQLDARRESYQLAEQSKAAVMKERQKVYSVIEAGKGEVAKVESVANQEMKEATVNATREVEVAEQTQQEEVAVAEQALATVKQKLLETEQLLTISAIALDTAKFEGKEMISQAEATRAKLEKGGAVSEVDQLRAEMRKKRMAFLASLANVPSPKTVIISGSKGGNNGVAGTGTTEALLQLFLLKQMNQTPTAQTSPLAGQAGR